MQWELDHVFLACPEAAAPQKALSEFGIVLEEGRVHRGQGTANVCAFFENAYLELLFPVDDTELRSEIVAPLGLMERISWQETGACPFGVCFRPGEGVTEQEIPPVEQWVYAPAYVPPGASIPIVTPRYSVFEPLIFLSTHPRPVPRTSEANRKHRGAYRNLTRVEIQHPEKYRPSAGVQWFADNSPLSFTPCSRFRLELVWDDGGRARQKEFDSLPFSIRW